MLTRNIVYSLGRTPSLILRARHSPVPIRYNSGASKLPPPTPEALRAKAELQKDWLAPLVHYDTVKQWSDSPSPDKYLIDVREPDETVQGIIPSAVTLPLTVLGNSLHLTSGEFKKRHGYDKPKREQEIVFYCRSGKRSQSACDIARRNGYTDVKSYDGSWLDWVAREQSPRS